MKQLPNWCSVGWPAALLTDYSPSQATLVTITKINVTVEDGRGRETVLSIARGLTYSTGTWGRRAELLSVGDPRVDVVFAAQRRARITRVAQDALADWAQTGDDASLQAAVEALREAG